MGGRLAGPRTAVGLGQQTCYSSARIRRSLVRQRFVKRDFAMRSTNTIACIFSLVMLSITHAQDAVVQPASHVAPTVPVGQSIRFAPPQTAVGERVVQRVGMELNIHTIVKQSGKVAHDGQTNMRSRQEREIEVLQVVAGKAVQAQVTYPLSRSLSPENPDPADEVAQAVEGKSYSIAATVNDC